VFDWSVHEIGLACEASSDYSIFMWNITQTEETSAIEEEIPSVTIT